MPTMDLDSDVHAYILGASRATGQTPSTILRHTFQLPGINGRSSGATPIPKDARHRDLLEFLRGPKLQASRVVTKKYLALLGFLYRQGPSEFAQVLELTGRHRRYFGRTRDEIAKSGKSLHPHQIPGSPFWVMTNADTEQKRELVQRVVGVLGYDKSATEAAAAAIA